jgi:hypothetical protein
LSGEPVNINFGFPYNKLDQNSQIINCHEETFHVDQWLESMHGSLPLEFFPCRSLDVTMLDPS